MSIMKSTAILELMVSDHAKILGLLKNLEKNLGGEILGTMQAFDTFEWSLEKHLFTEEKAIFTSYNPTDILKGYAMVPELIKEHNEILNRLRLLRRDLLKKKKGDFEGFKQVLNTHRTFEEQQLYPKLDQELGEEQKQAIINRIREITV